MKNDQNCHPRTPEDENMPFLHENTVGDHHYDGRVVGIVGCNATANVITNFAAEGKLDVDLKFFHDPDTGKAKNLASQVDGIVVKDVNDMLDDVDLVIETASPQAVKDTIPQILKKGKDVIITSVSGLVNLKFKNQLTKIALKNNCRIYTPSGAIVGLDGVKAASIGEITNINVLIRDSPESLGISADEEIVFYEGKSHDALSKYPLSRNAVATLSIVWDREVDVKIIADPKVKHSCHEIHVIGDFGELKTTTHNINSTTEPRTDVLVAYSVIKLLKDLDNKIKVGT